MTTLQSESPARQFSVRKLFVWMFVIGGVLAMMRVSRIPFHATSISCIALGVLSKASCSGAACWGLTIAMECVFKLENWD